MHGAHTIIIYSKGRKFLPLTPCVSSRASRHPPSVHPSGRPCGSTSWKLRGWLRNGKEINQEEEEKKILRTKDMTDVKTSIYLWTKDVTNIRCHVWCYWEQEFGEPMGTYLAHHWLVSETVVVDKKNTNVGWVFDFFVIPICSDYLEEKKQNERTIGFGYLKIFRIKRITGLGYLII